MYSFFSVPLGTAIFISIWLSTILFALALCHACGGRKAVFMALDNGEKYFKFPFENSYVYLGAGTYVILLVIVLRIFEYSAFGVAIYGAIVNCTFALTGKIFRRIAEVSWENKKTNH